jgi:hypothetical protein
MKSPLPLLLLALVCCTEQEVPNARQQATTCRLQRMEDIRPGDTSQKIELTYNNGKLKSGIYRVRQDGMEWQFVENRLYAHRTNEMDIHIMRTTTDTLYTGTFIYNDNGLTEYRDDYFAYIYRFTYDLNVLRAHDGRVIFVVQNGNIVERREFDTGILIDRFTYDNHPNPLHGLYYEPLSMEVADYFKLYNQNNVLTHYTPGAGIIEYSYEYTTGGFPSKRTTNNFDQTVYYSYKCE